MRELTVFLGGVLIALGTTLLSASASREWHDPGIGLATAAENGSPVLLLLVAPSGDEFEREALELLDHRSLTRTLTNLEAVRLRFKRSDDGEILWPPWGDEDEKGQGWNRERVRGHLEGGLGILGEASLLCLLDSYGQPLVRFDKRLPNRSKLRKALSAAVKVCNQQATLARKVAVELAKVGVAIERKKYADACRLMLPLEEIALPRVAPVLAERDRLREKLEKNFRLRLAAAEKLEKENKLGEAAADYEKVLREFPIPGWQREVRERIGRVWRKIQGPNPPGGA